MKRYALLIALTLSPIVGATVADGFGGLSYVIHTGSAPLNEVTVHVTNVSDKPISYARLEVAALENSVLKPVRYDATCKCGMNCKLHSKTINPRETITLTWDRVTDACRTAPPGQYNFVLMDVCPDEGCVGMPKYGIGQTYRVKE